MIKQNVSFRAWYTATVIRPNGEETKTQANLLLDNFFVFMQESSGGMNKNIDLKVGTGTSTPDVSQVALDNEIAYKRAQRNPISDVPAEYDSVNNIIKATRGYLATWNIGDVVGNLTELGANVDNGGGNLVCHSRALFTDSEGNPTTVVVTAEDQLILSWTVECSISSLDRVVVLNSGAQDHTITLRPYRLNYAGFKYMAGGVYNQFYYLMSIQAEGNSLVPINGGDVAQVGSVYIGTRFVDSKEGIGRKISHEFPINIANYDSGIGYLVTSFTNTSAFTAHGMWQISIDPPLMKTEDDRVIFTFYTEYTRA